MEFKVILGIILAGILSNNIALLEFLGTGAVLENERSTKKSLALGLGTTIVMVLSTAATWPLNHYLLEKVPYLQTMAFVLVVLVIVEVLHLIGKRILDNYCRADFVKFAINGAVLGLCIHNVHHSYLEAVITAAGIGIGFMLTMTLYAKLKDVPVDEEAIPAPFRGLPIALLTAGMIVLALMALQFKF
jgi:electron transport complex protein RnfA